VKLLIKCSATVSLLILWAAASATPQSFYGPIPAPSAPVCKPSSATGGGIQMSGAKAGLVRGSVFNFDSNGNGIGPQPSDPADRVDNFAPPASAGGVQPGDLPVAGDWTGDGHAKAGWFRPSTSQWWLDANNNGVFDSGDYAYHGLGGPGDVPVIGDWAGLGKSAIGIVHAGYAWFLDLNADGMFQPPSCAPAGYPNCGSIPITGDALFAFAGPGDFPVVGNWYRKVSAAGYPISQAGAVRSYTNSSGVRGGPFLWLLDSAAPGTFTNVTPQSTHSIGNLPGLAFGGSAGDVPVTGDWYNDGVVRFGDFAQGFLWVFDGAAPLSPQDSHLDGMVFGYGGLSIDKPIVGKW
jgi:hypothetical protein